MFKSVDLSETYLEFLIARDLISAAEARSVLAEQRQRTPQIGRIALKQGFLNPQDIGRILDLQVDSGMRFGEQAIALGLINEAHLTSLLATQWDIRPGAGELLIELGYASAADLEVQRADFMTEAKHQIV